MSKSKFIKYQEWDEYWCFKLINELGFEVFEDFNKSAWKPLRKNIKIVLESNRDASEPKDKQLETLQFIKSNQPNILESIYNFHQKYVFPLYKVSIDIDEDQIISNQEQTNLVYSIKSIQIPHLTGVNANYFILNFHFNYDDEHDMSFLFKNLSVIDFVGLGDDFIDYEELYENNLKGGNLELTITIYDKPNSPPVFRSKYSFLDKIDFLFEKKAYTISVYREKWPQSFKLFFHPEGSVRNYSLIEILKSI